MSRGKVPVFDHTAKKVLYHETRARALELIGRGVVFVLATDPLEVALTRPPAKKVYTGRPDQSLTVPPGVLVGAVDDVAACKAIVEGYAENHRGQA